MDSTTAVQVPKLSETNFHTWKQRVQYLLAMKDLDDYIYDDPPTAADDPDGSKSSKWARGDRKAKAVIGLTLSDDYLTHVRDIKSAKDMFKSLTDLFERTTLLNIIVARRKFYTANMAEDEKVMPFINRVKTLASTLKSMGTDVTDSE